MRGRNWGAALGFPAVTYGTPIVIFGAFAHEPNWGQFWENAATPYGTMTAGYAAIAAAGIAFANGRAQRRLDKDTADREHEAEIVRDLRTRFTTASQQLADKTTTIQQAGAYALASLANDWTDRDNTQEAQVCVDVLCTYLRTHHHAAAAEQGRPYGEDYDYTQPPPDQAVRDTIVRIINTHTQLEHDDFTLPGSWSHLDFDFTGAHLHNVWFFGAQFEGKAFFRNLAISGRSGFYSVDFSGPARFNGSQFAGDTEFVRVSFYGDTRFADVSFTGSTTFDDVLLFHTRFSRAVFSGNTTFNRTRWRGSIDFKRAQFTGPTAFDEAQFIDGCEVHVDWSEDLESQPPAITPRPWPPQLAAESMT